MGMEHGCARLRQCGLLSAAAVGPTPPPPLCFPPPGPASHYCENIGRSHKSNNIFFVVNFTTGLFAQKCHDPDCCHFRRAPGLALSRACRP